MNYFGTLIITFSLLAVLNGLCFTTYAQEKTDTLKNKILGIVKSAKDGSSVSGVSVIVKGTKNGTVTDSKGRFNIQAKRGDTLLLTAVGFTMLECPCGDQSMLTLTMPEDIRKMDEVVVVGYGIERKKNITGSISSIDAEELSRSSTISFDNAIIGKAAGVNVMSSSGVPGSATAITIRGLSTLNPDGNNPLIVIDGIPVYGSGKSLNNKSFSNSTSSFISFGGTSVSDNILPKQEFENNPLSALNPADIESIEILKDAYATSIYGSRGAAGVILVTTKKGTKDKALFNVQYVTGTVQPIGKYKLLSGAEYNEIYTTYYQQLGQNTPFNSLYETDWVDEVTRTAISQQIDISMAGAGDKMQYYVSGSYTDQPSYIIHNNFKRYTGRVNLTYRPTSAFSAGINMSMSYVNNSSMNAPLIYRNALLKAPNLPVTDDNGNYLYGKGTNPFGNIDINPVADAVLNTSSLQSTEGLGNIYLQFKPFTWLALRSEFGTQFSTGNAYTRRVKRPSGFGDDAVASFSQNRKIVLNNTINFLKTINNVHYINAVTGQSYEESNEAAMGMGGYGFFSDDILSISAAKNKYVTASGKQKWALVSYFARLNYDFSNKYLAGITYRMDGSSRFSSNRRYVGFPSFSAGWRLSEEDFLMEKAWIVDLKLRASIGFSGNNNSTSYYGSQGQYRINNNNLSYAGTPILQMQQPDNPNLKWERTRSVDIGMDGSLFQNRFTFTVDYYQRRIKDMIMTSAIPRYQGWVLQPQNIGDMINKGWELMMNAELIKKTNFSWSASFNISRNTNKILRLNFAGEEVGLANDAFKYLKAGDPAGQFYLYNWEGVDPMTGNPIWSDGKGNASFVPPASRFAEVSDVNIFRTTYGSSLPDFFGGMGHIISYKNFELNAFFSYSLGNKMINGSLANLLTYATEDANNLSNRILDYWLVPGHETTVPRLVNQSITSSPGSTSSSIRDYTVSRTNSRYLEDAGYLRLRTVSLMYNFKTAAFERLKIAGIHSLNVFVRATNLYTLTNYSGLDPEVNAFGSSAIQSGYDELTMPQNKIYQFGLNIGL